MIRVGIGGWNFKPWRGVFYPKGLKAAEELAYASRHLSSIEINATFYRTQSVATFERWARETPDDFVFALKGPRAVSYARSLADGAPPLARFLDSGMTALGHKLGPLLWQLPATRRFDARDLGAFLDLLPRTLAGRPLRHALEVRHDSFKTRAFVDLMRAAGIPVVYVDSPDIPGIADITGDFVYARLMRTRDEEVTGYAPADIAAFARRIRLWAKGGAPATLPRVGPPAKAGAPRDCFIYVISGAKVRAPAAAQALIAALRESKG